MTPTPDYTQATLMDATFLAGLDWLGHTSFHATVDLKRRFTLEELERAVEATIRDLPVLGCRYAPGERDRWLPAAGPLSEAVCEGAQEGVSEEEVEAITEVWVSREINTLTQRPFRVVLIPRSGGGCRLLVSLLHIVTDGGGAMAMAQVLGGHLYQTPPPVPVEPRRDAALVFERIKAAYTPAIALSAFTEAARQLALLGTEPMPGVGVGSGGGEPCWTTVVLGEEEVARFKAVCRASGATVNDGLVACLARLVGRRRGSGPLAAVYTVNQRRYMDPYRLAVGNLSGLVPMVLPRGLINRPVEAIRRVAAVNQSNRALFRGMLVAALPVLLGDGVSHRAFRGVFKRLTVPYFDWALRRVMVITNIGRLDDGLAVFGDDLEEVAIIGPCARAFHLPVVTAWGHRGRIYLHMYASPGAEPERLEELAAALRRSVEEASPRAEG